MFYTKFRELRWLVGPVGAWLAWVKNLRGSCGLRGSIKFWRGWRGQEFSGGWRGQEFSGGWRGSIIVFY